jgi:hypothetical protein
MKAFTGIAINPSEERWGKYYLNIYISVVLLPKGILFEKIMSHR